MFQGDLLRKVRGRAPGGRLPAARQPDGYQQIKELGRFKAPRRVIFGTGPRTSAGTIQKLLLRGAHPVGRLSRNRSKAWILDAGVRVDGTAVTHLPARRAREPR